MDAIQAKQLADELNKDNSAELEYYLGKIAQQAQEGKYEYNLDYVNGETIEMKTCVDLQALGFLVITSGPEVQINWKNV